MSKSNLVEAATTARQNAYAPYSNYKVGAAVQTEDGVYVGANVENASYGLTICAERVAITRAVTDGRKTISAVAVVTQSSPPAAPCGMCLQTLHEFAADAKTLSITLTNPKGEVRTMTLAECLPHGFSSESD